MRGIIVFANARRGRFAAQTDDAEFIYFELMDSAELLPGTIIEMNHRGHGGETFRTADGEKFAVYVEIDGAHRHTAHAWAFPST